MRETFIRFQVVPSSRETAVIDIPGEAARPEVFFDLVVIDVDLLSIGHYDGLGYLAALDEGDLAGFGIIVIAGIALVRGLDRRPGAILRRARRSCLSPSS